MTRERAVAVVLCIVTSACEAPRYGVRMTLDATRELQKYAQTDRPIPLSPTATIAFSPPTYCSEPGSSRGPGDVDPNLVRSECGVILSKLEQAAAERGFAVVSWQTLRGTRPPLAYARENNVDYLFEINEVGVNRPNQRLHAVTEAEFFELEGTHELPVAVRDAVALAKRCEEEHYGRPGAAPFAFIDLKMVTVADGRVTWVYRDVRGNFKGPTEQISRTYLPEHRGYRLGLLWPALGSIGVGGGLIVGSIVGFNDVSTGTNVLAGVGGSILLVGGLALAGLAFMPRWASPEETICAPKETPQAESERPRTASRVTLSNRRRFESDPFSAEREELVRRVIDEFANSLAAMRNFGSVQ